MLIKSQNDIGSLGVQKFDNWIQGLKIFNGTVFDLGTVFALRGASFVPLIFLMAQKLHPGRHLNSDFKVRIPPASFVPARKNFGHDSCIQAL